LELREWFVALPRRLEFWRCPAHEADTNQSLLVLFFPFVVIVIVINHTWLFRRRLSVGYIEVRMPWTRNIFMSLEKTEQD
jgi:hypothetical protein